MVPIEEARDQAKAAGLDLVEVGATADPPVVKIMDWGKVKFERDKKAKEAKKKATTIEVKEVKYRPTIDEHDFQIKTKRPRCLRLTRPRIVAQPDDFLVLAR